MMKVIDLPTELLADIPNHLDSFNDWYSLIRTCGHFYNACTNTKATFAPSQITIEEASHWSPPRSMFLIGSARKVADWAIENTANRRRLHEAISRGLDGRFDLYGRQEEEIFDLCVDVIRMGFAELRAIYHARREVVDPISRMIDQSNLGDWHGTREVLCHFMQYCELFHHSIDQAYGQLPAGVQPLEDSVRRNFMAYCIAEISCCPHDDRGRQRACFRSYKLKLERLLQLDCFANFSRVSTLLLGKAQPTSYPDEPIDSGLSDHGKLFVRIIQRQRPETLNM